MKNFGISFTLFTNVISTGFGLIGSILLARELGAEGRGELAAIFLWPSLLVYLISFGLISSSTYFSSNKENNTTSKVFSNLLFLGFAQSVCVMVLGYMFLDLLLDNQSARIKDLSRFFLWMVPLGLFTQYFLGILKSYLYFFTFNLLRLIIPVGYLVCILCFAFLKILTLDNLVLSQIILNFVTLVGAFAALGIHKIQLGIIPDFALAKRMLTYGIKVWVGDLSQSMNLKLDQVLIANMLDLKSLGLYVVALSAVSFSSVISEAFKVVLSPVISSQTENRQKREQIVYFFENYWTINVIMHLGLLVTIPFLIPIVFGSEYMLSILPAEILILASLFINAKNVLAGGFQGLGYPLIPTIAEIIGLLATILSLVILLKPFGIIGASIASLIAYFAQYSYVIFYLNRICSLPYSRIFKPNFSAFNSLYQLNILKRRSN